MTSTKERSPEIWTIGGGKGGTGKSFIISSMGNCLALRDKKVVLIDADLGGANLHTFLGIDKPRISLTDFFENNASLSDLIVDSGIKNMGLLIGAIHSLSPDGIKYTQKQKLFRHIKQLNADYILIDLGAGSHFNTIDTFLLADKMVVVILPEITSIENLYYFLKNAFFRQLINSLGDHGLKDVIQNTWKNRREYDIKNLNQLIDYLKGLSKTIENIINNELFNFRTHIILNRISSNQEIMIGNSVKSICKKYFGLNANYVGYIENDTIISRCINKRQPYIRTYPASRCAKEIERLTENLLEGRDIRTNI
ncbi:MAG: AAA family ATPase [Desulfobacteraceae bacterium]|nr:MAG: AAA family ATPase [Desulfobacteraceae bacterium]